MSARHRRTIVWIGGILGLLAVCTVGRSWYANRAKVRERESLLLQSRQIARATDFESAARIPGLRPAAGKRSGEPTGGGQEEVPRPSDALLARMGPEWAERLPPEMRAGGGTLTGEEGHQLCVLFYQTLTDEQIKRLSAGERLPLRAFSPKQRDLLRLATYYARCCWFKGWRISGIRISGPLWLTGRSTISYWYESEQMIRPRLMEKAPAWIDMGS